MGDPRRFTRFAELIKTQFPNAKNIADVAGGKGYLQLALKEKGYENVTTFDKRKHRCRRNIKFKHLYFSEKIKERFDLIVGMHPDEATDVIVVEASKRKIPFAIVPCCVKPTASIVHGQYNYTNWIKHLKQLAERKNFKVQELNLRITGKRLVIIGRPK